MGGVCRIFLPADNVALRVMGKGIIDIWEGLDDCAFVSGGAGSFGSFGDWKFYTNGIGN